MLIVQSFEDFLSARNKLPNPVGLVPTMGFLHAGHLSLVKQAKNECASVVVSIFVNPTQFGPQEDLGAYPRDLPRDLGLLKDEKVDLVWTPSADQMYPAGYQTWITVGEVTKPLEGAMRPGHFRGVATIVAKLFNAARPDKVFFGQKDAQQVAVIKQMTVDLSYPLDIVVCPIIREPDGLAMSSRNTYLSTNERSAAKILYRSLVTAQNAFHHGERSGGRLRNAMMKVLASEPLASVQYVSCADPDTLEELETVKDQALLSMAVYIGKTRLIDNLVLRK